jgi:hypothetical protein
MGAPRVGCFAVGERGLAGRQSSDGASSRTRKHVSLFSDVQDQQRCERERHVSRFGNSSGATSSLMADGTFDTERDSLGGIGWRKRVEWAMLELTRYSAPYVNQRLPVLALRLHVRLLHDCIPCSPRLAKKHWLVAR